MNITTCPNCGGRVRSETIGWKCESCQGFIDMRGEFHQHKEEPFMPPMTEDDLMQAAATAISTLQAESEKLRAELEQVKAALRREQDEKGGSSE